jgi:hypothetical protein
VASAMMLLNRASAKAEFRKMWLGGFDHRRIDLELKVLCLSASSAMPQSPPPMISTSLALANKRHLRHHFLIDELIAFGDLHAAIEHQHLAEEGVLEQQQVLVRGACLVMHLVDTITHAEAEFVEQRFGDPSFVGNDRSRALRSAKWVAAEKETA